MVKTPHGRKPGPKHAKIVKRLRHRRRMAAARAANESPSTTQTTSEISCEVLERAPELQHIPPRRLYFTLAEAANCISFDDAVVEKDSDVKDQDKQIVPYKGGKALNRGASEAAVGSGARNLDRSSVSESRLHKNAIPMPPPPAPEDDDTSTADDASTAHEGHFTDDEEEEEDVRTVKYRAEIHDHDDRLQHPDEHTDRYLSHLFSPSVANITTANEEHHTHNDTHSHHDTNTDDFQRLRNLFSSDSQRTVTEMVSASLPSTLTITDATANNRTLRHVTSNETSMGLRTLFDEKTDSHHQNEKYKPGLPTIFSETTLGLNTLFNNKTLGTVTSCETTMGLRTLFDEHRHQDRQVQSTASTLGLRSLFNHDKDDAPRCFSCNCKSVGEMPSMTNFSSTSLLGNLFGSEHAIHEGDENLSDKERKKVLIAKDLAQYLNSDDERTHGKSTTLSTFVLQIEQLFEKYRIAIAEVEILKQKVAELKKD